MTMYLRRRAQFSAGFLGLAGRPPGGHNYLCELAVAGEIDHNTGMVINITDVDAVLKSKVVRVLDNSILDRDVPGLQDIPVTPENLTRYIWTQCENALPPEGKLAEVKLFPTPTCWGAISTINVHGDMPMMTITRAYEFSASHRLHAISLSDQKNVEIFGKCNWENGHGHNYEVEVTLTGEPDLSTGEIVSPALLDNLVEEEILRRYDHKNLNLDAPEFATRNPTSENVTKEIWDRLEARLNAATIGNARLYRVLLRETARNSFEYYGD